MLPVYTSTDRRSQTSRRGRNKSLEWSMVVYELPYRAIHFSVSNARFPTGNAESRDITVDTNVQLLFTALCGP